MPVSDAWLRGLDNSSPRDETLDLTDPTLAQPDDPSELRQLLLGQRASLEQDLRRLEKRRWPWTWGGNSVKKQRDQLRVAIDGIDRELASLAN